MTSLIELAEARLARGHPDGWEPGLTLNPQTLTGHVTMAATEGTAPDVAAFVRERTADLPEPIDVDRLRFEPTQFRTWEQKPGEWLRYFRFTITPSLPVGDMTELLRRVRKRRAAPKPPAGDHVFVVNLADLQIGKHDPAEQADQLAERLAEVRGDIKTLRRVGYEIGPIVLANVGDPIEGVQGHYPMQQFTVKLNLREQVMLAREILDQWITDLSALTSDLTVVAVDSNHSEIRQDGQAFTSFDDTIDRLLLDELAFAYKQNPERYGHVTMVAPPLDDLTVAIEVAGTRIGWAHGHQVRSKTGDAVWKWWQQEAFARTPVGGADLLITGHFHHFSGRMEGTFSGRPRMWLQCPSHDYDSAWFRHKSGAYTVNGVLTLAARDGRVAWMKVV